MSDRKSEKVPRGTCPACGRAGLRLGGKDGRIVLAHSVPRELYKDGRGCRGAGRVAVEKRAHQ